MQNVSWDLVRLKPEKPTHLDRYATLAPDHFALQQSGAKELAKPFRDVLQPLVHCLTFSRSPPS